jgi:hypothetical protein
VISYHDFLVLFASLVYFLCNCVHGAPYTFNDISIIYQKEKEKEKEKASRNRGAHFLFSSFFVLLDGCVSRTSSD